MVKAAMRRSARAVCSLDLDGILDDIRGVASGSGFSDDVSILRLDFGG
jgi:hypothetical protein